MITEAHFRCQIFGLDDFAHFLQAILLQADSQVIILTQRSASLRRLLSTNKFNNKFLFYTRTSSTLPYELKLIEILNSTPDDTFLKTQSVRFITSFPVSLRSKHLEQSKPFDLFQIQQDPNLSNNKILIQDPPAIVHGCCFSDDPSLMTQASTILAQQAIKHSYSNSLQIIIPQDSEVISYQFHYHEFSRINEIFDVLNSLSFLQSFHFSQLMAAKHDLPKYAYINFLPSKAIDCDPLIALFQMIHISYLQLRHTLLFIASSNDIEAIVLTAQETSIPIPPSFLSTSQRLSFEKNEDQIFACVTPISQHSFLELQINREDVCCSTEIFWSTEFLDYLRSRFCINTPSLKFVRSPSNVISEVLSFTASYSIADIISLEQLPFQFSFNNFSFTLSFLEPLFTRQSKPLIPYPFESQGFHLQRMAGKSDAVSSLLPVFHPHPTFGGPRAVDFINFVTMGQLPECEPIISYLYSDGCPHFYLFISPLTDGWTVNLNLLFPSEPLQLRDSNIEELAFHIPHFVLLETSPDAQFSIPYFEKSPAKLSKQGWIKVTSFSTSYLLLLTPSSAHVKLLYDFWASHGSSFSPSILLGFFPSKAIPIQDSPIDSPVQDNTELKDTPMEPALQDIPPLELPEHCPSLLLCYRIFAYFSWDRDYDHVRQRLLEAVAGGLHSSAPSIHTILVKALNSFHSYTFYPLPPFIPLFTQLCLGLPDYLQKELFPSLVICFFSHLLH